MRRPVAPRLAPRSATRGAGAWRYGSRAPGRISLTAGDAYGSFAAMDSLDPATARARPAPTPADARALAARHWGLEGEARELPSERDRVFEIAAPGGDRAVLKVSNALERADTLDLQAALIGALADHGTDVRLPAARATRDGETRVRVELADRAHFVRLLEHVPGIPLAAVDPVTPALRHAVGALVGGIARAVENAGLQGSDREMVWDLRGAPELVARHLDRIAEPDGRALVEGAVERARTRIGPRAAELAEALIYNDANPANVHVTRPTPTAAARIVGLVDFGDAIRSWVVADLAVACAYLGFGTRDPVGAFCDVVRGYVGTRPLPEVEADLVYDLARLRLALSITIASVRAAQEPDNDYLRVSRTPALETLARLAEGSPDLARYRIRDAAGLAPCPASRHVIAALATAAATAAPLLDPDPRSASTVTLDLSIATGDDGGTLDPTDSTRFDRLLFDPMRDAGAAIGIGRYDEVRWWYTGEAFRTPRDGIDAWRTVHLGIDLFAEPGTAVRAPLAGTVVSVRDNAGRLDYGPTVIIEHEIPAGTASGGEAAEATVRFRTLYGHLSPETLARVAPGRTVRAGEEIGWIGAPPRNGDWAPHLHFQIIVDPLDHEGTFPGVAAPGERAVWRSLSPDPNTLLAIPAGAAAPGARPRAVLLAERRARLGPSLSLSYREPLHIVRGHGARLYDADGQPYLDGVNNVAHVGHAHPRVVDAARRQMGILNTNTRYLHESILEYARRLIDRFPDPLEAVYFVCSGTEANELALRMARAHTGRVGAVVLDGAYHGNSASVINLSPYKFRGPGGKGLRPWVRVAAMPDRYRGKYRGAEAAVAPRYAAEVRDALEALETERVWFGDRAPGAAAFFHESLLSCGGQIPLPTGFLEAAYGHARARGAVCVADEVQVGFGRVGTHFWGFEEHGVVPDIVTLGKPMGNGHPLAAVVTTRAIAASFDDGMEYFNTFGGNPVSCEVGLAVLDVIEDEGLQRRAREVGGRLLAGLREIAGRHPLVGDARGRGLFLGIELVLDPETREPAPDHAAHLVERLRDLGILLSTDGPDHNVIKLKPPLVFSAADADRVVETLDRTLSETALAP